MEGDVEVIEHHVEVHEHYGGNGNDNVIEEVTGFDGKHQNGYSAGVPPHSVYPPSNASYPMPVIS